MPEPMNRYTIGDDGTTSGKSRPSLLPSTADADAK
jgi:hypothetical protein